MSDAAAVFLRSATLHFGKLRCITMLFRFWVFPDCTFLDISKSTFPSMPVTNAIAAALSLNPLIVIRYANAVSASSLNINSMQASLCSTLAKKTSFSWQVSSYTSPCFLQQMQARQLHPCPSARECHASSAIFHPQLTRLSSPCVAR